MIYAKQKNIFFTLYIDYSSTVILLLLWFSDEALVEQKLKLKSDPPPFLNVHKPELSF